MENFQRKTSATYQWIYANGTQGQPLFSGHVLHLVVVFVHKRYNCENYNYSTTTTTYGWMWLAGNQDPGGILRPTTWLSGYSGCCEAIWWGGGQWMNDRKKLILWKVRLNHSLSCWITSNSRAYAHFLGTWAQFRLEINRISMINITNCGIFHQIHHLAS